MPRPLAEAILYDRHSIAHTYRAPQLPSPGDTIDIDGTTHHVTRISWQRVSTVTTTATGQTHTAVIITT